MSASEVRETLAHVERKVDEAAARLGPILTGATSDPADVAKAVHDALNHLASVRLRAGLALEHLEAQSAAAAHSCHADGQGPCVAPCCPIAGRSAPAWCVPAQHLGDVR